MIAFESIFIEHADVSLPFLLVLANFIYVLAVDEEVTRSTVFVAVLLLPQQMMGLALSFLASFAIATSKINMLGSVLLCAFLVMSVITVILTKKSERAFKKFNLMQSIYLLAPNFLFSFLILSYSISKLKGLSS